jgi:hypothetical protein
MHTRTGCRYPVISAVPRKDPSRIGVAGVGTVAGAGAVVDGAADARAGSASAGSVGAGASSTGADDITSSASTSTERVISRFSGSTAERALDAYREAVMHALETGVAALSMCSPQSLYNALAGFVLPRADH